MQVVLYDPTSKYNYHALWAKNFKAADPSNRKIYPIKGLDIASILEDIRAGARGGGTGSTVIFACGHGGTDGTNENGFVDLAPGKRYRLGRNWRDGPGATDVFYNVDFGDHKEGSELAHDRAIQTEVDSFDTAAGKQALKDKFKTNPRLIEGYQRDQRKYYREVSSKHLYRWLMYKHLGYAFQQNGVDLVVFLTCNMGQSETFVRKIATDWGIKTRAYRKYIWFGGGVNMQRPRVYLDGDPSDDLSPDEQTREIPQNPKYFYTAGPLPGTEEANRRFWELARVVP